MRLKLAALAIIAAAAFGLLVFPLRPADIQVTLVPTQAGSLTPAQIVGAPKSKVLTAFSLPMPLVGVLIFAACAWTAWRIVRKHRQAG
jgi:hypothetical protein